MNGIQGSFSMYMRPASERRPYNITSSLIGWMHTQNDPPQSIITWTSPDLPLMNSHCNELQYILLSEASFGLRVLSSPASVCVSVYVCVCVCQSLACPRDNSGPVQARIAKFGPKMQKTLVKVPIVLGGNWPWPSRSNLTAKSEFTPFWACPDHYSPPILVRISKFGQQMHFSTVKIPVNSGLDWLWTSPSFLTFFFHCGGVHWDCETVPGLFQCCSGTVSQSLHQCTWETHNQSGMRPLVL